MATTSRSSSLAKKFLALLVLLYCLSNFILMLLSATVWARNRTYGHSKGCSNGTLSYCGPARWITYAFLTLAALIVWITTAVMFLNAVIHSEKFSLDSRYVFRTIGLTVLLYLPIFIIGWSGFSERLVNPANPATLIPAHDVTGAFVGVLVRHSKGIDRATLIFSHWTL